MFTLLKNAARVLALIVGFPFLIFGQTQGIQPSPTSLTFASESISTPSPFQQITLQDTSQFAILISSITVSGDFSQSNNCSGSIAFAHHCTMSVGFTPTAAGTRTGSITIKYKEGSGSSVFTLTINLTGTGVASPLVGYINPKYVIVGITYAPPGPNSSVTYTNSTLVGNTITLTSSFSNTVGFSVSVETDISAWSIVGGAAVKVTATESSEYTQGSSSSTTTTVSQQASVSDKTNGTGNAFSPVNHDYDTIWLWLNPLMIFSIDPNSGNITWNGYGYDSHDVAGPDVFPVQVGYLNGDFGPNSSIAAVLARNWVTSNEPGVTWPAGDGPGLTSTDISNILAADFFTNPSYTLPSPLPTTSADGRFTQIPFPPNPVAYEQAGLGNGGGLTTGYNLVNTNTTTLGQGTSYMFKQTFGTDEQFKGGTWFAKFTLDLKQSDTLTFAHTWQHTLTTTQTLTNALSITGPGCPQTTEPCVPTYTGPAQFIVYQDNQYGTFMFYPKN